MESVGAVPFVCGGTFSFVVVEAGSAASVAVGLRGETMGCAVGSTATQISISPHDYNRTRTLPFGSSAFTSSPALPSAAPSALPCSFEIAETAPLFGASASTVDTGGETSSVPVPSFSGSFSVSPSPAVVAAPKGGPGAGSASLFCGTASCGTLCSPADSGCVGGTGRDSSVAPCSGDALARGGSCGALASICEGGGDCAGGAVEEDGSLDGGGVEVDVAEVGSAPSCLPFLPRLKMPLKTRLTMLAASGAAGALYVSSEISLFAAGRG